jgi:hypothetical protein
LKLRKVAKTKAGGFALRSPVPAFFTFMAQFSFSMRLRYNKLRLTQFAWNMNASVARKTLLLSFAIFVVALERPRPILNAAEPQPASAAEKDIARLKSIANDQSHAMADVGYHFANCWFAGEKKNWPLAKFYLDETRSHLKWAVRIIPVRKTKVGDLELQPILEAIDGTLLSEVSKSIDAKDVDAFRAAYRKSLEGCYSCHKAADKPYLRPQIPTAPPQPIINFDPDSKWPE